MSDRFDDDVPLTEEDWELEIAGLLAGLPLVDPPPGFIDAAIDRRPKHARRIAIAAVAASGTLVVASVVFGMVGPGRVAPSLDWITARHSDVAAAALSGSTADLELRSVLASDPETQVTDVDDEPLDLPDDYEHRADLLTEDLQQAVYAHGDETVSVFVQPGKADFDSLGRDRLRRFGSVTAWVDETKGLMVVETSDGVVTVVGLTTDEMAAVLSDARPVPADPWSAAARELTAQLGFPD